MGQRKRHAPALPFCFSSIYAHGCNSRCGRRPRTTLPAWHLSTLRGNASCCVRTSSSQHVAGERLSRFYSFPFLGQRLFHLSDGLYPFYQICPPRSQSADLMEDFLGIEGSKLLAEFLRSPRSQCGTATLQLLLCAACGFHADVDLGGLTTLQLLRQATFGLQASIGALILQRRRLWSECA